jgi:hypothetical protein
MATRSPLLSIVPNALGGNQAASAHTLGRCRVQRCRCDAFGVHADGRCTGCSHGAMYHSHGRTVDSVRILRDAQAIADKALQLWSQCQHRGESPKAALPLLVRAMDQLSTGLAMAEASADAKAELILRRKLEEFVNAYESLRTEVQSDRSTFTCTRCNEIAVLRCCHNCGTARSNH